MEKTDAASVEPITEPISSPSNREVFSTRWQKSPASTEVMTTPNVESSTDWTATGFAIFQLVPKPP